MTERIEQHLGGDVIFSTEPGQRDQPLPVAHVYMDMQGIFWRAPQGLVGMCRLAPHDVVSGTAIGTAASSRSVTSLDFKAPTSTR